ncbi:transmembrane channel-like protein 8 [Hyperolius riggenbachi]|uniref:transmembrane channel-like protein 8 n=1 Tax=Hyperolius riggenbachi TaxID=752182 RepID=UPI0035A32DFD
MTEEPPEEWNTARRPWRSKVKYDDPRASSAPMREKRRLWEMRQSDSTTFHIPWTQRHCSCLPPAWAKLQQILAGLKLWEKSLVDIRGRFGSSIRSYFSFLRFLMFLNVISSLLTTTLVILPTIFLQDDSPGSSSLGPCGNASSFPRRSVHNAMLAVFTGEGFMEDTFLFYGHYRTKVTEDSSFNVSLAYLLTPVIFLSICSLGLLQCTVKGITERRMRSRDYRTPISSRVFAGWDFCIREDETSQLRQQSLSYEFKTHLAEERWYWEKAHYSLGRRAHILILRLLLNCFVLALMAGGFYVIYLATNISQDYQETPSNGVVQLMIQYLVPIVISLVLLILPRLFILLVKFEGHSPSAEITLTLIRCVFLRLGTLGMFFFSLGQKILCLGGDMAPCGGCGYNTLFQCWETVVGQEMYKLSVFHFLQQLMEFFLLQIPRRLIVSRWQCRVVRWLGKEKFRLAQNALDTVYGQTLVLGGMFYAPLLPLLNLLFIFITFYIKRFSLYRLCDVSQKLFRESTMRILFHFVLLLGLMTVFLPLIFLVTSVRPSHSCGLFAEYNTPWEAVQNSTRSALPPAVLVVLSYATAETSAYSLLFILCLVLTSMVSQVRQNEQDVERLKDLLSNQIEDKEFLVVRLREEQDRQGQETEQEMDL